MAVHGGDGGILFYEELARRLPEDRPFLAIESPDLSTSGEIRVASIEVTARNYIGLLKKIQQTFQNVRLDSPIVCQQFAVR